MSSSRALFLCRAALFLFVQSRFPGRPCRLGRPTPAWATAGALDEILQPCSRGFAVRRLCPVLARPHYQHIVGRHAAPGQLPKSHLRVIRKRRSPHVITELNRRRDLVDVLAARAGGADEVFGGKGRIECHWLLIIGYWLLHWLFAIGYWAAMENSATPVRDSVDCREAFNRRGSAHVLPHVVLVTPQELRDRTRKYALDVAKLAEPLFAYVVTRNAGEQLSRAAASAAANYRAACVARSHDEFRAKIGLALEECDESVYWLEFVADNGRLSEARLRELTTEGRELTKILGASKRTSRARSRTARPRSRK